MIIFVGNLPEKYMETEFATMFEPFGIVASVTIIRDTATGEPQGFGFVDMPSDTEAQSAINGLDGIDIAGKTLSVTEARPRPESMHLKWRDRR